MTTIRIDLPLDVILDLPPATMATLVNPVRLRALLCELSDEELARLFEREDVQVTLADPLAAPVLQKRRGRPRRVTYGAGVDSPADMEPGASGTIVQHPPRPRQPKGGAVQVPAADLEAVHATLTDEPATADAIAARYTGAGFPVVRRALEILAMNGRALLGEDGYRRVPGQG